MSTNEQTTPATLIAFAEQEIVYPVTTDRIAELRQWATPENLGDITTDAGYEKHAEAIKTLTGLRTAVEKRRVDLKAGALAYGRNVDATAKRLTQLIVDIEEPLKLLKQGVDDRAEEIKRQIERELAEAEEARLKEQRDGIAAAQKKLDDERAEFDRKKKEFDDARQAEADARLEREQQEAATLKRQASEDRRKSMQPFADEIRSYVRRVNVIKVGDFAVSTVAEIIDNGRIDHVAEVEELLEWIIADVPGDTPALIRRHGGSL